MQLDITKFFNECAPIDYSASVAEIGRDAAKETWGAALSDADEYSILPDDNARDAFRAHIRGFGAWDDEEISAFTHEELNALCMQMVAADMRDVPGMSCADDWDWGQYYAYAEKGTCGGRLSQGDDDDKVYYYLGD